MKRVLITGVNSYVGNSFAEWVQQYPQEIQVDKISLRDDSWKDMDFSTYDSILHVAGIAHVSRNPKMQELYYKVNRDLTIEVAEQAKTAGVKQFIFMSSIIVYGDSKAGEVVIDEHTEPNPTNFYGQSKLDAEAGVRNLEDNTFNVAVIRPPMIYGKGSKGNYPKLAKAARKLPVFPENKNKRSMLHIDNLTEFLRLMIKNNEQGLFFPQNGEYVCTSNMVKFIADIHNKKIHLTKIFNPIIYMMISKLNIVNKVFGSLVYSQELSSYKENYRVNYFHETILKTEEKLPKNDQLDVLLMTDNGIDTVGGEQESTKIIINAAKDNFSTGVIQPGEIKHPVEGVHYYPLTSETRIKHMIKNPVSFLNYLKKVRSIIKTGKPRVIHTQSQVSFFIVALLRKYKLIPKKFNLIHTERGLYTKYSDSVKKVFFFFMKELDVLVTTTEFNMKYWQEALQNRNFKMDFKVIENTAGELFETYDDTKENKDDSKLIIGFAGRYAEWKNWPLAVEISEKLNDILGENLEVRMAVGCLDKDSEKETQKMFKQLKNMLGNRFKGNINIDLKAMDKFYYDIDIFILTSNHNTESFGRTLVEAMSRNTVVLTTNSGGSVEVVGNKDNVLYSSNEFVERVIALNENRDLMNIEKERNMKYVKGKYSLISNINRHILLYKTL